MDLRGCIVGLGNPGQRYSRTRHNFGFLLADRLRESCQRRAPQACADLSSRKVLGELSRIELHGSGQWLVLKPMTYMNESGRSVGYVAGFYKLPPERFVVLHDELDLPLGRMKFKQGGGNAGHNGLKSISAHLGSGEFFRLRLGIGKPEYPDTRDHVLSPFTAAEATVVDKVLDAAEEGLQLFVEQGFTPAQQFINGFAA